MFSDDEKVSFVGRFVTTLLIIISNYCLYGGFCLYYLRLRFCFHSLRRGTMNVKMCKANYRDKFRLTKSYFYARSCKWNMYYIILYYIMPMYYKKNASFLKFTIYGFEQYINPLKPELYPICYLLPLLAHHFLHVSRIRVKSLTFR